MQKLKTAIYAGSFDPLSYGHINIIERALTIFDKLIVAITQDNTKKCLFTVAERLDILKEHFKDETRLEFTTFTGLLVTYAKKCGVSSLVRGIRTIADYEYELQMSIANRKLDPDIDTVFFLTEGQYSHISSSIIKQIIQLGGSGKDLIHPVVEKRLKSKLKNTT